MKNFGFLVLLLLSVEAFGQSSAKQLLQSVGSVMDAEQFVRDHPKLQPLLKVYNSEHDTSQVDRQLYQLKKGVVLSFGDAIYKIISDTVEYAFRASYIYLDGSTLSQDAIDSLRKLIRQRYTAGTTFEQLADEFTMDANKKHGDLGVFSSGMMVREFEDAVRSHTNGEVFTIDIPSRQWYYVVKKTAPNQVEHKVTVLSVTSR